MFIKLTRIYNPESKRDIYVNMDNVSLFYSREDMTYLEFLKPSDSKDPYIWIEETPEEIAAMISNAR